MSLSKEQKQELFDVLGRTGGHREVMKTARTIPAEYQAKLERVDRREERLSFEGMPSVRVIVTMDPGHGADCPLHVNFHGGGFIFPQDGDDDLYCANVALGIHGIVVDVDYACSDTDPYPAAVRQAWAVTRWAAAHCAEWGADAKRVSVGGHSAGGNLAAVTAMEALRTGELKLNLVVLDYAANDNYFVLEGEENIRSRAFSLLYADGDAELLKDPYVSPVFASEDQLKGFPPTLIVEAGQCPFVETNRKFGAMLEKAGSPVRFARYPESRHGFTVRMNGDWQDAQQAIIDAINDAGPAAE